MNGAAQIAMRSIAKVVTRVAALIAVQSPLPLRVSTVTAALSALIGMTLIAPCNAQTYPNKPIRLIVPLAAGSAVDNAARILMLRVAQDLGTSVAIENQPGASGLIGAERVAHAAPDGYTLGGFNDSIMTMLPNHQPPPSWDILRDFEPITLVATIDWGLVVGANSTLRNAADLIAAARSTPGRLTFGSGGTGSPQHIAMALFASQAGIDLVHVPYKGATQAAVGVAGDEVVSALQGIATVSSLLRAGKLRLIGVATTARMSQFPEVPTIAESGLSGFEFNSWFALMAPAGTARPIIKTVYDAVLRALADPDTREKLAAQGLSVRGMPPAELSSATRVQLQRYADLMRQVGISAR